MTDRLQTLERIALLHQVEFFAGAPTHVLAAIAGRATEITLAQGDRLVVEGDRGDCLYVIAAGRVRIEQSGTSIAESGVGDVVGELALLAAGPRTATAVAIEPGVFLRVGGEVLDELLLDHPDVTRGIIDVLVRRLVALGPP